MQVLPGDASDVHFLLVPHAPGVQSLPHIRVTALNYSACVEPLAGSNLFVMPAAVEAPATAVAVET